MKNCSKCGAPLVAKVGQVVRHNATRRVGVVTNIPKEGYVDVVLFERQLQPRNTTDGGYVVLWGVDDIEDISGTIRVSE